MRPSPRTILPGTLFAAAAAAVVLCACSTTNTQRDGAATASVRKVDFAHAPELQNLAGHARQFGDEMYPKICALLLDDAAKPPKHFDLIVQPLKSRNRGEAHLEVKRIYLDSASLTNMTNRLEQFDKVFVHEMAHLATLYQSWLASFWDSRLPAESYWGESIADFARFKLIGTNGWACPECNLRYPHYTSGYACGGAFLLHVEANHGTNLVRQLVRELRQRTYTDEFFTRETGKPLEQLWSEFEQSGSVKPIAREAFQLQRDLGYRNGLPPRDILLRFENLLSAHGDEFTKLAIHSTYRKGKPTYSIRELICLYLYLTQPGGSPEQFLYTLGKQHALPGKRPDEKVRIAKFISFEEMAERSFPTSRTLDVQKAGDKSHYHYTVTRASQTDGWKLERAWRTSADGKPAEEYVLPTK